MMTMTMRTQSSRYIFQHWFVIFFFFFFNRIIFVFVDAVIVDFFLSHPYYLVKNIDKRLLLYTYLILYFSFYLYLVRCFGCFRLASEYRSLVGRSVESLICGVELFFMHVFLSTVYPCFFAFESCARARIQLDVDFRKTKHQKRVKERTREKRIKEF